VKYRVALTPPYFEVFDVFSCLLTRFTSSSILVILSIKKADLLGARVINIYSSFEGSTASFGSKVG
jgi:hypothetical protein